MDVTKLSCNTLWKDLCGQYLACQQISLRTFFAPVVLGNFRAQWESLPAQPTPATLPTPLECSCSLGDVELDPRQRHHQAELVGCRGPWLRNRTEEGHCWGCVTDTWAEGNQMEQGSLSHGDHEKTTGISIGHGKWIQAMLVSCKPTLETQTTDESIFYS